MDVSSLLAIDDSTLLRNVLPAMNVEQLSIVCSLNRRLDQLCDMEELWQNKVIYEYPSLVRTKPVNLTWRNYYLLLYRSTEISITYNQNQIGTVRFIPRLINLTISLIIQQLANAGISQPFIMVFTDDNDKPIIVRQNDGIITVLSNKLPVNVNIVTQSP
jgi:hypothetical protein